MTTEEFLEENWKISGMYDRGIELESKDSQTHIWVELDDILRLIAKLHLQYMDDEVAEFVADIQKEK